MVTHIPGPTDIPVPGGKIIQEYVGRVNSETSDLSIARMVAPGGWSEPFQTPQFDEYTLVLRGTVRVDHPAGTLDVTEGQAVLTRAGERIRYSSPDPAGAEYVAICLPAFAPDLANRDD